MVALGTPYAPGARGPDAYDCWGVVLAERPDVCALARYRADDRREIAAHVSAELASGHWARVWPPEPGDVVMMGTSRRLHHAGVAVEGGIKHTTPFSGVLIQSLAALRQTYSHLEAFRWVG